MHMRDETILILGGSGLVGQAVARRLFESNPARVVIVSLREEEVVAAKPILEGHAGDTEIVTEWGNVFVATELCKLEAHEVLDDDANRQIVVDDLVDDLNDQMVKRSFLFYLLDKYRPSAVVDCINTATAFAYKNVFKSARDMLSAAKTGAVDEEMVQRHVLTLTMPQLIRHIQLLLEGFKQCDTKAYAKIGTSGTGGMGLNIPYTHSEEKPSRMLLTKAAVAGAQSLLLFLVARTPGAPAVTEIKPTATIGWREIAYGPVSRAGKTFLKYDCSAPRDAVDAFGEEPIWTGGEGPLQSVFANMGENGVFARQEFETVTSLGSMELITPEEVADYVVMELQGRPTGKDIIAALDSSSAGPTYRAGLLRAAAIDKLAALEKEHGLDSVGFEMLGPPRLTKLLYEAHILSRLRGSYEELAASSPADLSREAEELVASTEALRTVMISVGIPIVTTGEKIYRGPLVMVQHAGDDIESAIPRGWVDLREQNCAGWVERAKRVVGQATTRESLSQGTGSDRDWSAIDPTAAIIPSRLAVWIFKYEDDGERIKR
jgi:NAD(P)-dependent dehydrogenase (short-subunit alcohol dehydrogenase family)